MSAGLSRYRLFSNLDIWPIEKFNISSESTQNKQQYSTKVTSTEEEVIKIFWITWEPDH